MTTTTPTHQSSSFVFQTLNDLLKIPSTRTTARIELMEIDISEEVSLDDVLWKNIESCISMNDLQKLMISILVWVYHHPSHNFSILESKLREHKTSAYLMAVPSNSEHEVSISPFSLKEVPYQLQVSFHQKGMDALHEMTKYSTTYEENIFRLATDIVGITMDRDSLKKKINGRTTDVWNI